MINRGCVVRFYMSSISLSVLALLKDIWANFRNDFKEVAMQNLLSVISEFLHITPMAGPPACIEREYCMNNKHYLGDYVG